jgi:hypothetical protein
MTGKTLADLSPYTNFHTAQEKAFEYLGKDADLFTSPKKDKKYRIYNPLQNKWVDFGQLGYEDYTKHKDDVRRARYLARATNMKGNWRDNPYSPNNLSIHILW